MRRFARCVHVAAGVFPTFATVIDSVNDTRSSRISNASSRQKLAILEPRSRRRHRAVSQESAPAQTVARDFQRSAGFLGAHGWSETLKRSRPPADAAGRAAANRGAACKRSSPYPVRATSVRIVCRIGRAPRRPPQNPPLVAGSNSPTCHGSGTRDLTRLRGALLLARRLPSVASSCRQTSAGGRGASADRGAG